MRRWRKVDRLYIDLPVARPGSLNAYLIAALAPAIATLLRLAIDPWVEGIQFITYFPMLILVALACGYRAGVVATLLSTLGAWHFIIEPRGSVELPGFENGLTLLLFLLTGFLFVWIAGATRVAIGRYRVLGRSLSRRVAQRTAELESAQANLLQAQKMEAVGQLTGGIAHDFNNMLSVVIGNLDMARRRIGEGRDVTRQIEGALEGAQRAAALTRRLLVFARRQPLEPAVVDMNRLIRDLTELLRRTLGGAVQLETERAPELWRVRTDPAQMESAIINLAINARDAMPGGGALRIETANLSIAGEEASAEDALQPGDYVVLSVADSGTGMAPEVAARATEPFFTTKEVGRGTGLGLSQVYGFVRQSGGDIAIDSVPGEGTTVRLYLPRHHGEAGETRRAKGRGAVPRGSPGELVLVVDDEDQVRRTTAAALAELGYGVREAANGVEALALLASDPAVALLLTDIVMPGLDGRELAERALRQRPNLKILYTTGCAPQNEAMDALPDDHPAMLRKPFSFEVLARKVRALLDS